jgi:hypothetical protein
MSEPAFYGEFVDLHGALHYIPVAFDKTEKAVYELFQRQSRDVERAFLTIRNKYDKQLLHGNLPRECLLHSIGGRTHLEPQPQVAAEKMGMLAEDCLQAAFRTHKAIDEKNVQDVLEANYMQLKERVEREFPVYCVFHLKGVRPDFSNGQALVIEVKHIYGKNRTPQKIVEEMGSDISHYKDKVGGVLFIVYDPEGKIADKKRFTEECLRHANVYLKLIR